MDCGARLDRVGRTGQERGFRQTRASTRHHFCLRPCVCGDRKQLDLDTLVSTRGPNFRLSRLESRLMCPACASRQVTVVFEPPTNRQVGGG